MSSRPDVHDKSTAGFRLTRLILVILPAFFIGFAFGLGKIVRDCSLTCNVGYELSPLAILAIGLLTFPISSFAMRSASRLGFRRWQILSFVAVGMSFLVFWSLTYFLVIGGTTQGSTNYPPGNLAVRLTYLSFFVWLGAVGAIFTPNIKSTVYKLYPRDARAKSLALTTAAVIAGGLIGGLVATSAIPQVMKSFGWRYEITRDSLIFVMGLVMILNIPLVILIDRLSRQQKALSKEVLSDQDVSAFVEDFGAVSLRKAIGWIIRDLRLRRMASVILMRGIADTVLLYLFYWLVTEQTSGKMGRTIFFADFYIFLNGFTLLFLIFGTNRLINRFGLIFALLTLPVALSLGTTYLIVQAVMVVTYVLRILDSALEQSLYIQGIDRMLLEVDDSQVFVVRPLLQGLSVRVGRSLGAVSILVLALGFGISFTYMAVFFLVVLVFWILAALSLRSQLHSA